MAHHKHDRSEKDLLVKFGDFSKKITQNHHLENLSEFVLHDLCGQDLFALSKAAYLVNNPDFACLKGVAGYNHPDSFVSDGSWDHQKDFTAHMKKSLFNQRVRNVQAGAIDFELDNHKNSILNIASDLQFNNPAYHVWSLKHANQGILLFEKPEENLLSDQYLAHFLYMLSFCPIF